MDFCYVQNSELEPKFHKCKGRVVLGRDVVKDDSGSYACVAPAPVRLIEQLLEPPVLNMQEHQFEVAKVIPQERLSERSMVQFVDVPVPQNVKETVEMRQVVPQERFSTTHSGVHVRRPRAPGCRGNPGSCSNSST